MKKFVKPLKLALSICLFVPTLSFAHGDVTPQKIDITGLPTIKEIKPDLPEGEWLTSNPYKDTASTERAVNIGKLAYGQNCAMCHGLEVVSGGIAPDLRRLSHDDEGNEWFVYRVREGSVRDGRVYMPKMAEKLSQEGLWAIWTYIESVCQEPDRADCVK
ncbi:cytochrome c-550 PedF [Beggiatoa leptomitoformis]|uniref:Cytochrome c-550 PedF n=1 Tax=Beggiatoa leptomitoformis TaxID=288004 RepID=A0A2N9YJQ3_9GAMM|nr:cytochrome c-550 PedF [Beggiatoa leptomitoformis]ALG69374.2 cytochrome c-550 PedF [Beggiatoa leptomitoformis]AUI70693.2 cytochrome c-550 PedF [Beggiatoa leptomitoformis]